MKLSDVVSHLHLPIFAEVPLLVFMGIFIGVAVYLFGKRDSFAHMEELPLRSELQPVPSPKSMPRAKASQAARDWRTLQ